MTQATYSEMRSMLDNCVPFKGNSVTALFEDGLYKVYSYNTIIFSFDIGTQSVKVFDNSYYSKTTSKLQNLLIDVYKLNNGVTKRD